MKYISNAMEFGTQSRSSLQIVNKILENCGTWPEIKSLGKFDLKIAMCSSFYKIWHLVRIEHGNYEYGTWNWLSWPKIIDLGKFVLTHTFAPIFMKFGTNNKWNMLIMNTSK